MNEKIEKFRDGIFSLRTRRFGTVAELMIKKLYSLNDSDSISYDLRTKYNKKIEVKFSRVLKKCTSTITAENVIDEIVSENIGERILTFNQAKDEKFDCNIQQIKSKNFSELYYGCFFADKIMICKIISSQIKKDKLIEYSDYQHEGNEGEGQFHINQKTLMHHIDEYCEEWLTYEELYELFKQK